MFKKIICSLLSAVLLITATLTPMTAAAQSAAELFRGAIGDVSITPGGSMHSQARSIYSLGGGSVSSSSKSISLMSAQGPSFRAGCAGINWHFGGMNFITEAEIQKMVEAISQAALGLVIDLAMNVLCPQCYAVMGTIRDMANKMRNAAMDSCNAAKRLVGMGRDAVTKAGLVDPIHDSCAEKNAADNAKSNYLGGMFGVTGCSILEDANKSLGIAMTEVNKFLKGDPVAKPSSTEVAMTGNVTYEALSAMGYPDGLAKNIILSMVGMEIYIAKGGNCAETLAGLALATNHAKQNAAAAGVTTAQTNVSASEIARDTAVAAAKAAGTAWGVAVEAGSPAAALKADALAAAEAATQSEEKYAADAKAVNVEKATLSGIVAATASSNPLTAKQSAQYCPVAPLLTGVQELAKIAMCGYDPAADNKLYTRRMDQLKVMGAAELAGGSLARMCGEEVLKAGKGTGNYTFKGNKSNPALFFCDKANTASCTSPQISPLQTQMTDLSQAAVGLPAYTGLGWMIMDALMEGVAQVKAGKTIDKASPPTWLKLVESSDYPLYRVINLAAVYPGQAASIIDAYGTTIAAQHVMRSLEHLLKLGNNVELLLAGGTKANINAVNHLKGEIAGLIRDAGPFRDQALRRLREKQALVDFILQMNKALQADVMSAGLMGNANMVKSIKAAAADRAAAIAKQNLLKPTVP